MFTSGFTFIEQPLFIKNCGPATTIPMVIYTDSGTYEGFRLNMSYTSPSGGGRPKTISLDNYEYSDTKIQRIKGYFENDMWTGTSGKLYVELWKDAELVTSESIEVVEEEWTLRESLEHAHDELYASLKAQNLVDLDFSEVSGFGSLINKADEYMACKIITNPDQYSGHPLKNLTLMSDQLLRPFLRNTAVSHPILHREFTKKTNYTLTFRFHTSVSNRTGFLYGFEPGLTSGSNLSTSSGAHGLNIITDIGNTYIETFDNGSTIQLYTHTSNLFTEEDAQSVDIRRNGMTAEIYIDKELIYTHDNVKYNTIGLNKWGNGYNQMSNIRISIDPGIDPEQR